MGEEDSQGENIQMKRKILFRSRPPKTGQTFRLNQTLFEVLDVLPRVGYRSGRRWMIEVRRVRK